MNGVPVSAHLGRTVAESVKLDVYPRIEPYLLRALQGEAISSVEVRRPITFDGSQSVSRLNSYQPARDEAGEVIGISIVVMDITERTRAEEALRETQDHYRYMVELNPHIPWAMDSNGMNTETGPRWEELTGQTPEEAANEGFLAVFHPDDVAKLMPVIQDALRTGDPIDVEVRVRTRKDGWLWMRSRGKARRGPNGEILRWYGIIEDIAELKKVKQALLVAEARNITSL